MPPSPRARSAASATARAAVRWHRVDDGYSVIEVLISMTLFMGLAAASGLSLLTALSFAESNDNRVIAAGLAAAQIEQVNAIANASGLSPGTVTVIRDGTTFTVSRVLSPVSGCSAANTRNVTVNVAWTGNAVASDTVRAC